MSAKADEYVARARARIVELLREHHAMVHPEIEARLSENLSDYGNIDPHHVTTALGELHESGIIRTTEGAARGGRLIKTTTLSDVGRKATVTRSAEARKRLLAARYAGWSQGTRRDPHGLIGPAGEAAVRSAILDAGTLIPSIPGAREVKTLLNVKLPGPVDSAGIMVPVEHGLPGRPVTVLVEVKSLRSWIYPSSAELYQVLYKALVLQQAHAELSIMPVLVCRRAHETTFWMAKQLGFIVIETEVQFAGNVDAAALDEVRNELFLSDLRVGVGPSLRTRDRFRDVLPRVATVVAANWRATALDPPVADALVAVKRATKTPERLRAVDHLRAAAKAVGHRGGW